MAILCKVGLHKWLKCGFRCRDDCRCKCDRCKLTRHEWDGCVCKKPGCKETRDEGHSWNGCKCTKCGKTRNEGHTWDGCKCAKCGKTRDEAHTLDGCKCTKCGKTRDEGHKWEGCKCITCGKTRDESHDWAGCKCQKCGKMRDDGHKWAGKKCSQCGKANPDAEAAFRRLESQLHDGMTYEAAVRIIGNPTRTIGGGALMGAFGRVSGPGAGALGGMSFLEWQRPEGTFRANLRGGVLDDVKGWVE